MKPKCSFPKKGNCTLLHIQMSGTMMTRFSSRAGVYIACKDWKRFFLKYPKYSTIIWKVTTYFYSKELAKLRVSCGTIISYDWVSLPLVYTQLVTIATYTFFATTLLGRQWLHPDNHIEGYVNGQVDYYVPIFTVLQFLFYVGWLKVAEALLNPYGEDDEDFDTNWMVDRHLQLTYMMVDLVGQHPPKLEKDDHWDVCIPDELPYTVASLPFRVPPAQTSAELLSVPISKQQPIFPQYLNPNDPSMTRGGSTWRLNMALTSILTPMVRRRKASQAFSTKSTFSTKSMPNQFPLGTEIEIDKRRRVTTLSLSPGINRKMMKSRSPSSDSLTVLDTPEEPRSRKCSVTTKPHLTTVLEGKFHNWYLYSFISLIA